MTEAEASVLWQCPQCGIMPGCHSGKCAFCGDWLDPIRDDPVTELAELHKKLLTVEGECTCGAIPSVKYEPGVLMILCWRCRERGLIPHGVCVPDFDRRPFGKSGLH